VDISDPSQICAAGILVRYLARLSIVAKRTGDGAHPRVQMLQRAILDDYVAMDARTMTALRIFSSDEHPSVIKGRGRSKEGISIFSIFDRNLTARSSGSKDRLRNILLQPSRCLETLSFRLSAVADIILCRGASPEGMQRVREHMRPISNMSKLVARFHAHAQSRKDWVHLHASLHGVAGLLDAVASVISDFEAEQVALYAGDIGHSAAELPLDTSTSHGSMPKFLRSVLQDIEESQAAFDLFAKLRSCIDWDRASQPGGIWIKAGWSEELDALREKLDMLPTDMDLAVRTMQQRCPFLGHVDIETIPQLGCLVAISREALSGAGPSKLPSDFKFALQNNGKLYYRCIETEDLDDAYGDIHSDIEEVQESLLRQLSDDVILASTDLDLLQATVADLDVMMCFAAVSTAFEMTRPQLQSRAETAISSGRHILIDFLQGQ